MAFLLINVVVSGLWVFGKLTGHARLKSFASLIGEGLQLLLDILTLVCEGKLNLEFLDRLISHFVVKTYIKRVQITLD